MTRSELFPNIPDYAHDRTAMDSAFLDFARTPINDLAPLGLYFRHVFK
jgi:hypothetical protein